MVLRDNITAFPKKNHNEKVPSFPEGGVARSDGVVGYFRKN
jgi:hypothetical protein